MDVRVGLWRRLSAEELMLLNCGDGEDSWESLGLQGDAISPSERRSVLGVHQKDWCWSWNSSTLATSWEELTRWKRPWCWERLGAGGEGDDRGWDGWMASLTGCTWVWVDSGSWWWTARPGMLWFMGSQRVGHNWATELNVYRCECRLTKDSRYWLDQRNYFENKKNQQKLTHGSILICCLTIGKWVLIRICPGGRQQESKEAFCPLEDKTSHLV